MPGSYRRRTSEQQTHIDPRGVARDRAVREIARVAALPALDGRIAGPRIRQLRKNVTALTENRMAGTLYDLLNANGRTGEFAALLLELFAPDSVHAVPLHDALVMEFDVKCAEMPLIARLLAGEGSTPELADARAAVMRDLSALQVTLESLDAEIAARRLAA